MLPSLYSTSLAPPCLVNVANYNPPPPPPPPPVTATAADLVPSTAMPHIASKPALSQGNHLCRLQSMTSNSNAPLPRRLRHRSLLKSTSSQP